MASQELKGEPPQPQILNYKTWVLRVSVHCEGCKKKVRKIISQVPGVHTVDIDIRQQRVIVIGNVEVDTLIMKLLKSGKNAELWPEQHIQKEKKSAIKSKHREKQSEHHYQESQSNKEIAQSKIKQPSGEKKENNPAPVKIEALKQPPTKKSDDKIDDFDVNVEQKSKDNDDGSSDKAVESSSKDSAGDHQEKDQSKSEGKKLEGCPATPPPPAEAAESGVGVGVGGDGGGGGRSDKSGNHGKKKKNKGQNRNSNGGESSSSVDKPANMEPGNHHNGGPPISLMSANESPPRHHNYDDYPPHGSHHYGALPSPSYGLSYNTTYPTNTYTTSYYAPSPPPNSYLYSYQGPQAHPPPPLDYQDSYSSQPLDSFEIFSDENPNGCLVM